MYVCVCVRECVCVGCVCVEGVQLSSSYADENRSGPGVGVGRRREAAPIHLRQWNQVQTPTLRTRLAREALHRTRPNNQLYKVI